MPITVSEKEAEIVQSVQVCPLCGGVRIMRLFTVPPGRGSIKRAYDYFHCHDCGLGITSPRPTAEQLGELYNEEFYGSYNVADSTMGVVDKLFFHGRRKQIERQIKPGQLLDVGCGGGRFIRYMADHKWNTVGYDFSQSANTLAKQRTTDRVRIIGGQLSEHRLPPQSFDVITMWQVFEHIAEPIPLLRELKRLLKPGGLLVVAVPNVASFQAKLTGARWWGLDIPRHLSHYTPQSLRRALMAGGFQLLRVNHFSFRYAPYSFFHTVLDYFFTRRDFLSDLAKHTLPASLGSAAKAYNIAIAVLLGPIVFLFCIVESVTAPIFHRGGFIEAFALLPSADKER